MHRQGEDLMMVPAAEALIRAAAAVEAFLEAAADDWEIGGIPLGRLIRITVTQESLCLHRDRIAPRAFRLFQRPSCRRCSRIRRTEDIGRRIRGFGDMAEAETLIQQP